MDWMISWIMLSISRVIYNKDCIVYVLFKELTTGYNKVD